MSTAQQVHPFPVPFRVYIEDAAETGRWEIVLATSADEARQEANELWGPDGFEALEVREGNRL